MLSIITANPIAFILAIIIGLVTAWWMWGRAAVDNEPEVYDVYADNSEVTGGDVVEPAVEPVELTRDEVEPEPEPAAATAAATAAVAAAATGGMAVTPLAANPEPARTPLTIAEVENKPNIAAAEGEPDDLTRIKGIGPKLHGLCNSLGVTRFDQIAAWRAKDVGEVDAHLGSFSGRITRDEWVAQAKLLATGRITEHANRFGI